MENIFILIYQTIMLLLLRPKGLDQTIGISCQLYDCMLL